MSYKLKRDRYCEICKTTNLQKRYKCLRCDTAVCFECKEESFEGIAHSSNHPMQLLTYQRRRSDTFIRGERFPYMMASSFTCPICSFMGFDGRNLLKHIEEDHYGNNALVYCPICVATPHSSNASRLCGLWDHMRLHHLPSGKRAEALMTPLSIIEDDESSDESLYKGPNTSPTSSIDSVHFFNNGCNKLSGSVEDFEGSSNAVTIPFQMENDLLDMVEATNGDTLANETMDSECHQEESLESIFYEAQVQKILNEANVKADEISIDEMLPSPCESSESIPKCSCILTPLWGPSPKPGSCPINDEPRCDIPWERLRNRDARCDSTLPCYRYENSEAANDRVIHYGGSRSTFVLPRLWPQYCQEEAVMARAIARTTEAIVALSDKTSSDKPTESNDKSSS